MSERRKVPEGWGWVRLGNHAVKIGSGVTPRGGHEVYQSSGIPLIRSQNVHMNRFEMTGIAFVSAEIDSMMSGSRVAGGDVLLNITGASVGRVCVVPDEICPANVNQHVCIIRGDGSFEPRFLSYYLSSSSFQKFIADSQAGATRQALTRAMIEEFEIPLPPLPEQRRIVAALDEKLAAVARARAAARAQLAAARALPAAYLRAVFEGEEARGWPVRPLGNVLIQRREVIHPRNNPRGEAAFVGLEHVESGTGKRIGSLPVRMEELTGRKPKFYKNDIVYGYLRPYLNKVWVAEFEGLCSVDQYVYSVNQELATIEFVAWFMRSPTFLNRAPIDTTPGQLPRIRIEEVAAVELNLPPLEAQRRTMKILINQMETVKQLIDCLEDQLAEIETIPDAYLQQAFSGELH